MNSPKPAESDDPLLTASEAASYLNVAERFIRRLIAERRIEFVKLGKLVRIRRSALDSFVSAGVVERPKL